ncbi:hypothetical protein AC249_AIPGENE4182 [Exaiptasia diaphana]|nr:hypothetical protein AC249_AIPGENE4182 [Exaiptasia diaphana]
MRVNLAAQVLSASVPSALKAFGPPEAAGTARLCEMVDQFFDCLNVRSLTEHQRERQPFLAPYTSAQDRRFQFLMEFLDYLQSWKEKCTKFLLPEGMENVLTERFFQDPVEEFFGKQRQLGLRSDNPDVKAFGYNSNTIRIERSISCQSGNTRGRKDKKKAWVQVTDEKLPSRKKRKPDSK